jgi:bifunctional non-homologous end joining protein LigD
MAAVVTAARAGSIRAGNIRVELSNTGKVLFPGDEFTKGDLISYYRDVASRMLPYLRDRPIAMARYPDGINGQRIFQKNAPGYFPGWISRAKVGKQDGTLQHVVCDKPATLVYLANQACIELHVFLSRLGKLDHPDQLVFDLDPPGDDQFGEARRAALALRDLLAGELGLTAFVKTTGGKGLHIHVTLNAADDFDSVRAFARQAGGLLAARHPDLVTTEQRKDNRGGRVYIDIMRNAYAQTVVAPYVVRARPGAPVAVPLHWDEVTDSCLAPGRFTLRTVRGRLRELGSSGDPWSGISRRRYRLTKAAKLLDELTASQRPAAGTR